MEREAVWKCLREASQLLTIERSCLEGLAMICSQLARIVRGQPVLPRWRRSNHDHTRPQGWEQQRRMSMAGIACQEVEVENTKRYLWRDARIREHCAHATCN